MKKFKYGFTLVELLITIGVIGIIAAIIVPMFLNFRPDKPKELAKRAEYNVEQVVTQIYNDMSMYPENSFYAKQGFKNTDPILLNSKTYVGDTKFCELFLSRFEKAQNVHTPTPYCYENVDSAVTNGAPPTFKDGNSYHDNEFVEWYLPSTNFSSGYAKIKIRIPKNKSIDGTVDYDVLDFYVKSNGSISKETPATSTNTSPYQIIINVSCPSNPSNPRQCLHDTNALAMSYKNENSSGFKYPTWDNEKKAYVADNLEANETYTFFTNPKNNNDYYTNWKDITNSGTRNNQTKVKINGFNTITYLKLSVYKKTKSAIRVYVNNCDNTGTSEDNVSKCVTATYDSNKTLSTVCIKNDDGTCSGKYYDYLEATEINPGAYNIKIFAKYDSTDVNKQFMLYPNPGGTKQCCKCKEGKNCSISESSDIYQTCPGPIEQKNVKISTDDLIYEVSVAPYQCTCSKEGACSEKDGDDELIECGACSNAL